MKKIISAHLEQVIQFGGLPEKTKYFDHLNHKKERYVVLREWEENGCYFIRIRKGYNNVPMEDEANEV